MAAFSNNSNNANFVDYFVILDFEAVCFPDNMAKPFPQVYFLSTMHFVTVQGNY